MNKKYILIIILTLSLLTFLENTKSQPKPPSSEEIQINTFMCRDIDCEEIFINFIKTANSSIYCAFFDFDLETLNNEIKKSNTKKLIFVDGDNKHFNDPYIIYENRSAYMHNKFCIIDNKLTITGSFNPTINGRDKNDNNILIIQSKEIAEIYFNYFKNLIHQNKTLKRNYALNNISICFSRGGNCLNIIKNEINKANHSIYAMLFTMTDKALTNSILIKHYTNLKINAIFEKSLITKYSSYHKLAYQNINVTKDCNSAKLHHKVFIIDNKTIITGSMNPSHNADYNNEENVIIIKNRKIAEKYLNEFTRITRLCMT